MLTYIRNCLSIVRDSHHSEWDGCTSNKLHSIKPCFSYCNLTHFICRDAAILGVCTLVGGHTYFTHKITVPSDLRRTTSYNCLIIIIIIALTVVHILLICRQYNSVRWTYFSVTALKELFDKGECCDILSFIRDLFVQLYIILSFVLF